MENTGNTKIFMAFAEAINSKNQLKLAELMTLDHKFIDPMGREANGSVIMLAGWAAYFLWFPDYKIEIAEVFEKDGTVFATGFAGGTYKGLKDAENSNHWRIPAAWKAVMRGNQVYLWQVFADTKIPSDIIAKNQMV